MIFIRLFIQTFAASPLLSTTSMGRRGQEWCIDVHQLNVMLGLEAVAEITEGALQIISR